MFCEETLTITLSVIFMSAYIFLLFLLILETTYNRSKKFNTDIHQVLADELDSDTTSQDAPIQQLEHDEKEKGEATAAVSVSDIESSGTPEKRKTWLQGLKLYNGRLSNENYLRAVLSPFVTLILPAVHWAAYANGLTVAFAAAISVSLAQIFTAPPYNFTTGAVGLTVLSPLVGNIIGNFIPGPVADWLVAYMSRKNGGIYEPEFRNILCVPALVTGAVGFWGFGLSIHYRMHPLVRACFLLRPVSFRWCHYVACIQHVSTRLPPKVRPRCLRYRHAHHGSH